MVNYIGHHFLTHNKIYSLGSFSKLNSSIIIKVKELLNEEYEEQQDDNTYFQYTDNIEIENLHVNNLQSVKINEFVRIKEVAN